jgi:hypothetical protein
LRKKVAEYQKSGVMNTPRLVRKKFHLMLILINCSSYAIFFSPDSSENPFEGFIER